MLEQEVYGRLLDVVAIVSVPIKIFVMVFVVRYSAAEMRSFSMLLFNGLLWNFMANSIYAFLQLIPMFPLECFRANGLISFFTSEETTCHILNCILISCFVNLVLALSFSFPYRYMVFAHTTTVAKIKRKWVVALSIGVHGAMISIFVYLYFSWVEPTPSHMVDDDGPVICFKMNGPEKLNIFIFSLGIVLIALVIGLGSTVLLLFSIYRLSASFDIDYLQRHTRILWTLMWITSIPVFLGGIPSSISSIMIAKPDISYAQSICLVCFVIMANHGTVYSIALIVAIQPYRVAMKQLFVTVFRWNITNDITVVKIPKQIATLSKERRSEVHRHKHVNGTSAAGAFRNPAAPSISQLTI
uniref:G_PROTEIN_RECEP_F1_2 domain-containing protein n=1 Tax=Steinernema glaseri TaxID=37863 RepID=A0A1I8A2U1_9BILA